MIQKIEVEVKKVRYVGFESNNDTICCKYKQFGRGVKISSCVRFIILAGNEIKKARTGDYRFGLSMLFEKRRV